MYFESYFVFVYLESHHEILLGKLFCNMFVFNINCIIIYGADSLLYTQSTSITSHSHAIIETMNYYTTVRTITAGCKETAQEQKYTSTFRLVGC